MLSSKTEYTGVANEEPPADEKPSRMTTFSSKSINTIESWSNRSLKETWKKTIHKKKHRRYRRWKRLSRLTCFYAWPPLVMCMLVIGIILVATNHRYEYTGSLCGLDGRYNFDYQDDGDAITSTYNPWQLSNFFEINLGFGRFSFASAKLIDVCWDLLVGRGLQCILAFVSYKVCTRAMSRALENSAVSYGTFEAIALQHGSVTAVVKLIKDFSVIETVNARMIIFWIIYSTVCIWVFPTLAGAMTGYSATLVAYVSAPDGARLSASDFQRVFYIIHDGSRLGPGFYDNYTVVDDNPDDPDLTITNCTDTSYYSAADSLSFYQSCRYGGMRQCGRHAPGIINRKNSNITLSWDDNPKDGNCELLWRLSNYTSQYGLYGANNISSTFWANSSYSITLGSPVLNISAYKVFHAPFTPGNEGDVFKNNVFWSVLPFGTTWQEDTTANSSDSDLYLAQNYNGTGPLFHNSKASLYYNQQQMSERGGCQQQDPGSSSATLYQWGFSYQLLVSCLALLLVWSLGMYILHMDTFLRSHPVFHKREMGLQRAIMDLASEYEKKVGNKDVRIYGDSELKAAIGKDVISYTNLYRNNHSKTRGQKVRFWLWLRTRHALFDPMPWQRYGLRQWAREERRLLISLGVFALLSLFSFIQGVFMFLWCPFASPLPIAANLIALSVIDAPFIRYVLMTTTMGVFFILEIWWWYEQSCNVRSDNWYWGMIGPLSPSQFWPQAEVSNCW